MGSRADLFPERICDRVYITAIAAFVLLFIRRLSSIRGLKDPNLLLFTG